VKAEDHPLFAAWERALSQLVEAERRFHLAKMEGRPESELHQPARDLDEARDRYRAVSDQVGAEDS